eukprot:14989650-Ditylum_brightwellii.AAC.1
MVHAHNPVGIDRTVLFSDVDNGADSADKHLAHLSQAADCCMTVRYKQIMMLTMVLTMVMMMEWQQ